MGSGQKFIGNATFLDDLKQKIQKRQTCVSNTQEQDAMLGEAIDLQDMVRAGRRGSNQLYASATFSASSNRAGECVALLVDLGLIYTTYPMNPSV